MQGWVYSQAVWEEKIFSPSDIGFPFLILICSFGERKSGKILHTIWWHHHHMQQYLKIVLYFSPFFHNDFDQVKVCQVWNMFKTKPVPRTSCLAPTLQSPNKAILTSLPKTIHVCLCTTQTQPLSHWLLLNLKMETLWKHSDFLFPRNYMDIDTFILSTKLHFLS